MNVVNSLLAIFGLLVLVGFLQTLFMKPASNGSPDTSQNKKLVNGAKTSASVDGIELPKEMRHQFADLHDVRMSAQEQKRLDTLPNANDANYLHHRSPRTILKTTGCLNCSESSQMVPGKTSCLTGKYDGDLLNTNPMISDEFLVPYMGDHTLSLPMTSFLGEPDYGCLSEHL